MITVYSKPSCPQCLQATAMLRAKGLEFTEAKLDKDYDISYLEEICAATGQPAPRSFPVLFKEDDTVYIGTLTDLKTKLSQGLL